MAIFARRKKKKKNELEELLDGYELPTFSSVVLRVLSLLRDRESDMRMVSRELIFDPSLVVSVFKMVNSSAFGLVHKVDDISQAVMLLGRARVESIVLSHAVKKSLPRIKEPWFDMNLFWEMSGQRAALARNFAQVLHPDTAVQSFTAAMLQDIGMPVLVNAKAKDYSNIYDEWTRSNSEIAALEQDAFSFDHQHVGRLMAEEWNFPDYLARAIGEHHIEDSVDPAINIVAHLEMVYENGGFESLLELCRDNYNLKPEQTQKIIDTALQEASTISLG